MSEAPSIYTGEFFESWETFAEEIRLIFQYPDERAQYVAANLALATLLRRIGQPETSNNFFKLAEALQDVIDGVSHPLFKVGKAGKRGRQHDTGDTWRVRKSLCLGVQYLIAGGLTQEEAIEFVIRRHRMQLVKLQRPGTNLKSSLPTWLKSFATDAVSNSVALTSYKDGMKDLAARKTCQLPGSIRQDGERLIAGAAASAAKLVKI